MLITVSQRVGAKFWQQYVAPNPILAGLEFVKETYLCCDIVKRCVYRARKSRLINFHKEVTNASDC